MLADTRMVHAFAKWSFAVFFVLSLPICLIILIDDLASGLTSTQPHKPS
jgi:hypothetical protein